MNLLRPHRTTVHLPSTEAELPALNDEDPRTPRGCAWYDSSLDLRQGLEVTTHEDDHPCPEWLPLAAWLQWQTALPARA